MKAPSSLISRFAASTAIFAAAIVVLAYLSFHAIRGNIFEDSFQSPLEEWSTYIAGRIGEDPDIAKFAARNHRMGVLLTTREGIYAFGPDGEPVTPEFLAENHSNVRTILVQGHGGIGYSFYLSDSDASGSDQSVLWLLIGGLLFLVGVVYVVQLSQLRPLRWLKESVEKVSAGDLSTRVPVVRMDEVGQVARAFNHMTERVEQMLNDHDRLMADVSHELRSPLARMKVALEMLPEGDKREQIATDIREMEALTSALLERERIKNRTAQPNRTEVDLAALTRGVIGGFVGRNPAVVLAESPEAISVQADEALLKVLLQNLLENSVKFSLKDSGPVEVRLARGDESVTVRIDDDGRGIPEDMTERVLEPFVKLDPSRGHRSGYGLGLNLCQRIVEAHNGSIKIQSREPRGTSVIVELCTG
ncbi:MAG: HAMP domain-containing histidine kinase [Gammaproteobacteria bacterium]|nr:HAMP domain-containing histidine kinase [Gammaproteobacteria bacterium]